MADARDDPPGDLVGHYRPLAPRRRAMIAVLAVVTAIGIVLLLLYRPGGVQRTRPKAPDRVLCVNGQPRGCIDGKIGVIVVQPPPTPAPAPGTAASH